MKQIRTPKRSEPATLESDTAGEAYSESEPTPRWYVYMLRCDDNSLYTGITTEPARRLREHNAGGALGARCTRARLPVCLAYLELATSRSSATRREREIKSLSRQRKLSMVKQFEQSPELWHEVRHE